MLVRTRFEDVAEGMPTPFLRQRKVNGAEPRAIARNVTDVLSPLDWPTGANVIVGAEYGECVALS